MKKFIQYAAIFGAVLSVLGFGTAWAARLNGGRWHGEEIFGTSMTLFSFRHDHGKKIKPEDVYVEASEKEREETALEQEALPDIAEEIPEKEIEATRMASVQTAEGDPVFSFPAAEELSLSVEAGEVVVEAAEGITQIQIYYDQESLKEWVKAVLDDDGDELEIRVKKPFKLRDDSSYLQVKILVPAGHKFQSAEVSLTAGNFQAVGLNAWELEADFAAGYVEFEGCEASDADFQCVAGNIFYSGRIKGDVDGECAMGNIELSLQQREDEFNYELKGAGGSIQVGELKLGELAFERKIMNNAFWTMELESSAGTILVDFSV